MLLATQSHSIDGTLKYFDTILTQGDYYLGQEVSGTWQGKGAKLLGLMPGATVERKEFKALLEGIHPVTGKRLTQRVRKDRRPGVDFALSVPKSVSLAWAINRDERIIDALRQVVRETIEHDIEPLMHRRVRNGEKANSKARTQSGKLIYADFLHKTSRPVAGAVDPHLHVHAFVLNWTEEDGRNFAGEFEEIIRQRPSLQAKFHARLARHLKTELGYDVETVTFSQSGRRKTGWEITGISRETIERFSNRTIQVEAYAAKHGVTDPNAKGKLGKRTREKKAKELSIAQLRRHWQSRLLPKEVKAFDALRAGAVGGKAVEFERLAADRAVQYALEHHLHRESAVEKHQVVGTALEQGLWLTQQEIEAALERSGAIERSLEVLGAKRDFLTTPDVLQAEHEMICFAREGRGKRYSLTQKEHHFSRDWLNDEQKAAVLHVLHSRDTVTGIGGGAGTGKSSLMAEAAEGLENNGKQVFAFAPSTGGRDVLREKGFDQAETVEHLIRNKSLQEKVKDQVLWIDEAGLLDVRSMRAIFQVAKTQNARVVLSGDTKQHSSPGRGEAMRLLEREAGLNIARVEAIQRQKGRYREVVDLISRGHDVVDPKTGVTGLVAGFDMLDKLGRIKEIKDEDRYQMLAERYLEARKQGQSTLVVAPTHAEGKEVTAEIREGLRKHGLIKEQTREFSRLQPLNLTDAEKTIPRTFDEPGLIVQFHQNVTGGIKRGERFEVVLDRDRNPQLRSLEGGNRKPIPHGVPDRFDVYRKEQIELSAGDHVRLTMGGKALDGKRRISNGRLDEVNGFDRRGNLILKSGLTIHREFGHLDLGYVITSHAAQGKDRHVAIAALGSQSLPAINAKQIYVTVSRGRENVVIFVDDKAKVRQAIQRAGEKLSATELIRNSEAVESRRSGAGQKSQQRRLRDRVRAWWQRFLPQRREVRQQQRPAYRPSPSLGLQPAPRLGRS